ncbi:sugar transferase [Fibrobacter sp. UWB10]|uniref:sugar transferase n=1 Tax=Fibrobacter sp. UWB10 TaxID=1896201 RepID=UPI00240362C3|nr:sugar transferase [Fibrobacter sp. UWB10]SMP47299.1 Sugar transferase involved in LPS biosynthesis (colanic, teichoic acid) [Fibrobacter sp. UWB10]
MYSRCLKRVLDFCCALLAIVCLSPLLVALTLVGAVKMKGNPFFTQPRPGLNEKIFKLVKFRTMTNEKDANGNLLPDDVRLNAYGKFLRSTSLDELPELFNILKGDMAVIGPRPQLVRDMVFMTPEQRKRHTVRQGLSGLAQVNGRNAVTWESKIGYDLQYIEKITLLGDIRIILTTLGKVFKRDGITEDGSDTATDLGDYLLASGKITREQYDRGQAEAKKLIAEAE